ncbi:MAG: protoporphyrinogen oxidase [Acidobacteria bacterium]|nr:protoporphyrinogen oxidase [Acidobacteriota bacterium]
MKRLVIVGAGISGLAAARGARALAGEVPGGLEVLVLERGAAVGGKVVTLRDAGYLVEMGPTGYLDNEPAIDQLIGWAGMAAQKLPANAAAARRFLVRGGRPLEIQMHPLRFARSGLLTPLGLLRMAGEPFVPRKRDATDESVWSFAARRVGREAADRMISPMMLGIFAGDARRLSLPAAFPRLHVLERDHGGLVRGMLARRRQRGAGGPGGAAGTLTSFRDGLQSFLRGLAASPELLVRTGAEVRAIEPRAAGGWGVLAGADAIAADAVVLAGEPWAMAPVVREPLPALAAALESIDCPPVAVVALGYGREALEKVPRGFGVLVPRGEGYRILGVLWDTHLFEGRSPRDRLLVRAMLGGAVDPEIGGLTEERIAALARDEVARLFGLRDAPVYERTTLWPRAIPQYELGHLDRVAAIEEQAAAVPGLFVTGNALHGVAFAKAGAHGLSCGERAARFLAGDDHV